MIGIYAIRNKLDGKMYVGKSSNIERRLKDHERCLSKEERDKKQVNRFLWNSVKKHGLENFEFIVLEERVGISEDELKDLELHYMDLHNTCNRDFGYNLRRDSSTHSFVHEDTRKLMSETRIGENNSNFGNKWSDDQKSRMSDIKKEQMQSGVYDWMKTDEWRSKVSKQASDMWKDVEKKEAMGRKVAEATSTLRFYEYDKITLELKKVWNSMLEITTEFPDYHKIAIYSVCNGHKKSYRGSVWKSELKIQ